jgi:restriction system protein
MHNCTATMVVCNCSFTRAAQQLASIHGCQLIDRSGLERLVLSAAR